MANEFSITGSFTASSGGASIATGSMSKTFDAVASPAYMQAGTQSIGFGAVEQLSYNSTDITGSVTVSIKNLDSTNFVTIYKEVGGTNVLSVLKPGQFCILCGLPASGLYAKADTAAVEIQFWMSQL